jgi:hypothetical protein
MTLQQQLKELIQKNKTGQAIEKLLEISSLPSAKELHNDVLLISARYQEYLNAKNLGTSHFSEDKVSIARINQSLLYIIEKIPEDGSIEKYVSNSLTFKSSDSTKKKKLHPALWTIGIIFLILILGQISGVMNLFSVSPDTATLTVYVHGPQGQQDYVLENEGELLIDFDGDRRYAKIGEKGRTVFNEIPIKYKNTELPITIKSESYKGVNTNGKYKWNESAIYIELDFSNEMKQIQGIVKNEDGTRVLDEVRILIDNKYEIVTDSLGRFNYPLEPKQVKDKYSLFLQKEGYHSKTLDYYPLSSGEFRLSKIK